MTNPGNPENPERPYPKLFFTDKPFEEAVDPRVLRVWNLEQYEQRTEGWYKARMKGITASSISSALYQSESSCGYYIDYYKIRDQFVINPKKSCSYKEQQIDLIMSKCGLGDGFKGNEHTLWGQKYEPIVSNIYAQMHGVDMLEFGLIFHPEIPFLAASPDGISTAGVMLEIKCPPCRQVKKYPPIYYFQQIMMQLECTGLEECDYFDAHFIEYPEEDDFIEEAREWESKNPNTKHHEYGIIVSCNDLSEPEVVPGRPAVKNFYADPNVHKLDDFLAWRDRLLEDWSEDTDPVVTYYRLYEYYISRVKYDKNWFEKNLDEMRSIWEKIEYGRTEQGRNELLKIKQDKADKSEARRNKKRSMEAQLSVFVELAKNVEDGSENEKGFVSIKTGPFKECLL